MRGPGLLYLWFSMCSLYGKCWASLEHGGWFSQMIAEGGREGKREGRRDRRQTDRDNILSFLT